MTLQAFEDQIARRGYVGWRFPLVPGVKGGGPKTPHTLKRGTVEISKVDGKAPKMLQ